jgi:hypothetical protein
MKYSSLVFADTVITAGLLESTGENNRIHLSQETADLLLTASKGHWIEERKDKINLKGKDELRTYWLTYSGQSSSGRSRSSGSAADDPQTAIDEHDLVLPIRGMANPFDSKTQRLVEWNTDVLSRLLKDVVASRLSRESYRAEGVSNDSVHGLVKQENATVLDEVVEIISLPEFDVQGAGTRVDASNMDLSDPVKQQLRDYITIIASMYRYVQSRERPTTAAVNISQRLGDSVPSFLTFAAATIHFTTLSMPHTLRCPWSSF